MSNYSTIKYTNSSHNDVNHTISSQYSVNQLTGEIENYYQGAPGVSVSETPSAQGRRACSTGHILTFSKITGYTEGNLLVVNKSHIKLERRGGGTKGKITGFSNKSRRNLMHKLGTINKTNLPLWVTLTYPDEFIVNKVDMRKHFERFRRRLERSGCSGIWRLEWIQRKSGVHVGEYYPHYHLMIWGAKIVEFRAWVAKTWWAVCGKLSDKHLQAGTSADLVDNWKQLCYYVSKYMAKTEQLPENIENIGRLWGVINPEIIPWSEIIEWTLSDKTVNRLFRLMRKYAKLKTFSSQTSLSILCPSPGQWLSASLRL